MAKKQRDPEASGSHDEATDRYGRGLIQGGSGMRIEREVPPAAPGAGDPHAAIATLVADGMDVYDRDGERVGSIARVYRPRPEVQGEVFVEVETGFLGFGRSFYVPISHVREVDGERAHLDIAKDQLDQTGWDEQPPAIHLAAYQPE